jgi:hypothetical protein
MCLLGNNGSGFCGDRMKFTFKGTRLVSYPLGDFFDWFTFGAFGLIFWCTNMHEADDPVS